MHRNNRLFSGSLVVAVMMLAGKWTGHADELQPGPLSFLQPSQNATVKPGDTVDLELSAPGMNEILVVGLEFAKTAPNDGANRFKVVYPVPLNAIGTIKLSAFGKNSSGKFVGPTDITLVVNLADAGNVVSLRTLTQLAVLKVGASEQMFVYGKYRDGVERDITATKFGTEYVVSPGRPADTEIIRVDPLGKITALNPGRTRLTVRHKDLATTVSRDVIVEK